MSKIIFTVIFLTTIASAGLYAQTIIAPDNLEAESEDSSYIKVKWDDNSNNEEGFRIERTQINSPAYWEVIGEVPTDQRVFLDYYATRGHVYYYRVYAYLGEIRSDYSNIDTCVLLGDTTVIPLTPSNLRTIDITMTSITIQWDDNSNNELGFIIARKKQGELFYQYIDSVATDILTYQEVGLTADNTYSYKVCSFNDFGISDYTNTVVARTHKNTLVVGNSTGIPDKYFLGNNFPNPFNPSTNIKFGISKNSFVRITIYNSLGKEVENLLAQNLPAGTYNVKWNGANESSGMYFYRLETEGFSDVKKMILIK